MIFRCKHNASDRWFLNKKFYIPLKHFTVGYRRAVEKLLRVDFFYLYNTGSAIILLVILLLS